MPANTTRVSFLVQRYAEANMTSTITVARKLAPHFDPVTGALAANSPITIYTGKARIYTVAGPLAMPFGDELMSASSTYISIPMVTGGMMPMIDDIVVVTACPADPAMLGRTFQVRDVESAGQWPAARRMRVEGVQPSAEWIFIAAMTGTGASAAAAGNTSTFVVT